MPTPGKEGATVDAWHRRYGPIVRVSPDTLSVIGQSSVWRQIYGFKAKGQQEFQKDSIFYISPATRNQAPGPITAKGEVIAARSTHEFRTV
jgi:hypothetical protein